MEWRRQLWERRGREKRGKGEVRERETKILTQWEISIWFSLDQ